MAKGIQEAANQVHLLSRGLVPVEVDAVTLEKLNVDDHPLVREGLAARISQQSDMEICGEADSVDTALAQVKESSPDLYIIDIQLFQRHGIDLIKEIHSRLPRIKMLVVSAFDESLYVERALRAGAHG